MKMAIKLNLKKPQGIELIPSRGVNINKRKFGRRIQQLDMRPLQISEFLGPLSRTNYTWPEEWHELRDFDHFITGEKARMDKAKDATAA